MTKEVTIVLIKGASLITCIYKMKRKFISFMMTALAVLSLTNCCSKKESSISQIEKPTYQEKKLTTTDFDTYLTLDASSIGVGINSKNQKYIFIDAQVRVYVKLMYGNMLENSKTVKGTLDKDGY